MKNRWTKQWLAITVAFLLCLSGMDVSFAAPTGTWLWPFPTSTKINVGYYAGSHDGIDVGAEIGDQILAPTSGTIYRKYTGCTRYGGLGTRCKVAGVCHPNHGYTANENAISYGYCNNGYGNGICLRTSDGYYVQFAHMSAVEDSLYEGQFITAGTPLGKVGGSGYATGKHVHYAVSTAEWSGFMDPRNITYTYSQTDPTDCGCSEQYAGYYTIESSNGLAISSGHGASNVGGNSELGVMPNGAVIYISKAQGYSGRGSSQGKFGHVTYNGISGFCAMNLLDRVASYTLTLDASGGILNPNSVTVWNQLSDYYDLGGFIPQRSGYRFLGWFTAPSGGTQVYNAAGCCVNEGVYWSNNKYVRGADATLYAHWESIIVDPVSITLNPASLQMHQDDMATITATVNPSNTTNKSISWVSNNESVATVAADGTVTAVGLGNAVITCRANGKTSVTAECVVAVDPIPVASVTLSDTALTLKAMESAALSATILPDNATDPELFWYSDNDAIAWYDPVTGRVMTGQCGSTMIHAVAADGCGAEASCAVTVRTNITGIRLNRYSIRLSAEGIGADFPLQCTIAPENGVGTIQWTSSDPAVAAVSSSGIVTAKGEGTARVTAMVVGGPSIYCNVTVSGSMPLMTLPSELQLIEDEAFMHTAAERIALAPGVETIGSRAFASSSALRFVLIPNNVTEIAEDAFDGDNNLCLLCGSGSAAEAFAVRHSIPYLLDESASFVFVRSVSLPESRTLILGETEQLQPVILPENASNTGLQWSSSDPETVSVTDDGAILAVAPGSAIITASAMDGSGRSASCAVTVTEPNISAVWAPEESVSADNATLTAVFTLNGISADYASLVGISLYDAGGALLGTASGMPVSDNGTRRVSFDVNQDLGIVLAPSTAYTYSYTVRVANAELNSERYGFTTVYAPPTLELPNEVEIEVGQQYEFRPNFRFMDSCELVWGTSVFDVAYVEDGVLFASQTGTATITAFCADDPTISASCLVTVVDTVDDDDVVMVDRIELSGSSVTMDVGQTLQLYTMVYPEDADNTALIWESDDTAVAIAGNDTVTAVHRGTCRITVRAADNGGAAATCDVTVRQPVASVTLNQSSASVELGKTITLGANVLPANADNKSIVWASTNAQIATVNGGVITPVSVGVCTVTATAADGSGASDFCTITVKPVSATSVSLNSTSAAMTVNEVIGLSATVLPANAGNRSVNWTSSNTGVAQVDKNGVVTATGSGTAYITATAADGSGCMATCTVTVDGSVTFTNETTRNISSDTCYAYVEVQASGALPIYGLRIYNADGSLYQNWQATNPYPNSTTKVWFDTIKAETGITLAANTSYFWQIFVTNGGKTFYSRRVSFTTSSGSSSSATVNFSNETTEYVSTTTAKVSTSVSSNTALTAYGINIYSANGALYKTWSASNPYPNSTTRVWFDTIQAETGIVLQPGTSYSWEITVVASGKTYASRRVSFTTSGSQPDPGASVSFSNETTSACYETTASISTNVSSNVPLEKYGFNIYTSGGALYKTWSASNPYPNTTSRIWFTTIQSETGMALQPGTSYKWEIFVISGGTTYRSKTVSFSTTSSNPDENPDIRFSNEATTVVYDDTMSVFTNISSNVPLLKYGINIYNKNGSLYRQWETDNPYPNTTTRIWFTTVKSETGITLQPDTDYSWEITVDTGNLCAYSARVSFHTRPTPQADSQKISRVLTTAEAWIDHTWYAPVDIPVYNNEYEISGEHYHAKYWFKTDTLMHGIPYTYGGKDDINDYPPLPPADKGKEWLNTWKMGEEYWTPWQSLHGADCSCLVATCLYAGDPTFAALSSGNSIKTSSQYIDLISDYAEAKPADMLITNGHVMLITAVYSDSMDVIEQCGNSNSRGAIYCKNKTVRAAGGKYVCGTCEYCAGSKKSGTRRSTYSFTTLKNKGYKVYRYNCLYN